MRQGKSSRQGVRCAFDSFVNTDLQAVFEAVRHERSSEYKCDVAAPLACSNTSPISRINSIHL